MTSHILATVVATATCLFLVAYCSNAALINYRSSDCRCNNTLACDEAVNGVIKRWPCNDTLYIHCENAACSMQVCATGEAFCPYVSACKPTPIADSCFF